MQRENTFPAEVISKAPDDVDGSIEGVDPEALSKYATLLAELQDENARLQAEVERLSTKENIDDIRAKLIKPYANRVFYYLCAYSIFVMLAIVFNGFGIWHFSLDDSVISVLSGSTAVAAIGLVGIVVKGLFK